MSPWLGIGGVLAVLVAFLVTLKVLQKRFAIHPELIRKVVHIGMGLVTLSFPYLFGEVWPVLLLAIASTALLLSVRFFSPVQKELGSVLNSVGRDSLGEIYFPISVFIIFWLSHGDHVLFLVPVLVLTLADATGALIGIRYGLSPYQTDEGQKSLEGSLAFFLVAFLSVHVPVLLLNATGREESLLIGLTLAFVIMLMEAISWRGLDNLFVPLTTFVLLKIFLLLDAWAMIERLIVVVAMVVAMLAWRRYTYLSRSAVIGGALVFYTSWALGDWHWLLAPVMMLIGYSLLCPEAPGPQKRFDHTVHAIFYIATTGLVWLFLSKSLTCANFIYPYGVAYAAHLGMVALAYFKRRDSAELLARFPVLKSIVLGFSIPALPYIWVWRQNPHDRVLALAAFILVGFAVVLFSKIQPGMDDCPNDRERWMRQGLIAAFVSVLAFLIIDYLEPWSTSF